VEAARPATGDDLTELVELARRALAELAPTRGGAVFVAREGRAEPVEETLAADLADPAARVVVGTIDGTQVGYGVGRTEVLRDGSHLGVITDLFVDAEARSVGVGEAVMGELLSWFAQQRCSGVDATALPGNRATKNFFEESGFTARLLVMHHRLEGA
jgi:ribosomal protein S18 acetylase RimI-like enzyme